MEVDSILKNNIVINCNWNVNTGCENLKNSIKFSSDNSYNLEDVVQVESCVHLYTDETDFESCKLHIKLDERLQFTVKRVDVVSEARIIECYGSCEEYLDTIHGEYMDDFEGCTVYSVSSMLPSTSEITLKFAKLKHAKEMWLYGLLLSVEKTSVTPLKIGGIDLSNVNNILKDSRFPLSEKAEYCRRFLQQCGNSVDGSGAIDPHVLLQMFDGEYMKPLGESSRSMSKCLMRLIPFAMKQSELSTGGSAVGSSSDSEVECAMRSPNNCNSVSPVPSNNNNKNINNNLNVINNEIDYVETMKNYVDKRISDVEEKLTNRIEKRLNDIEISQNNKLDAIMKLLLEKK